MMALKYNCPKCGHEIISRYLKPGDSLPCPACRGHIFVPENAVQTDEEGNILRSRKQSEVVAVEPAESAPEPPPPPEPTMWNAFSVLKLILVFLIGAILLSCIICGIAALFMLPFYGSGVGAKELYKNDVSNVGAYIFSFIFTTLPAGLIYYSVVKRHHNKFFEGLRLVKMNRQELKRYMLVGAVCVAIVLALSVVIAVTGLSKSIPKDMPILDEYRHGYARLALFTIFALLGPAFEEILFRGYIFQGLRNSWGVKAAAIVVTVAFVMMHAPQLGYSIIMLFVLSVAAIALIWVRIKTDSLTKCIVIHQIYNTIIAVIIWSTALIFGLDKMTG
jgi:membrane protease YdiL (CAAX protease family)/DNA-directed RNA polymerase subunit RPC12/RpoP